MAGPEWKQFKLKYRSPRHEPEAHLYQQYTWPEMAEVVKKQPLVVLPIGSAEVMGRHLLLMPLVPFCLIGLRGRSGLLGDNMPFSRMKPNRASLVVGLLYAHY